MKKFRYIFLPLLVLGGLTACEKGDNLYTDPENPLEVTPATMLASLEVNTFQNVEGDFARIASMYAGQMAGATGQYQAFQNYDITEGDFNNLWVQLYSGTMKNAKILITENTAENPYYAGISNVLLALNLGVATDLWGDVPYTEAFQAPENFTAAYDPQASVLDTIQQLLDEAIALLNRPVSDNVDLPGADDLIFREVDPSGEFVSRTDRWIKAAWTLKARYANRMSLKDPAGSATEVLNYLESGMSEAADIMEAKHDGESPNQWGAFQSQREGYIVANKFFIDMLAGNDDPRLPYYFTEVAAGGYAGADLADEQVDPDVSTIGVFLDAARNFPMVTFFEAKFLEAEARARLGQDASAALNDAIRASVIYATAGADNGASIAVYTAGTATLENIMTEKWKAMFGQIEPYNDFRRTGFPAVPVRPGSAGAIRAYIPARFPTPQKERQNNPNAQPMELNVPVWWAEN